MQFTLPSLSALILLGFFSAQTLACDLPAHVKPRTEGNITYPFAIPGDDIPSDPATKGYFNNHLCINARDATTSIEWYTAAFGLRLISTFQVSEHFSISYMGHAQGGRNGTSYQPAPRLTQRRTTAMDSLRSSA